MQNNGEIKMFCSDRNNNNKTSVFSRSQISLHAHVRIYLFIFFYCKIYDSRESDFSANEMYRAREKKVRICPVKTPLNAYLNESATRISREGSPLLKEDVNGWNAFHPNILILEYPTNGQTEKKKEKERERGKS